MYWIYQKKPIKCIEDFPENTFGFVYHITHKRTGLKYIGKKQLRVRQKVKLSAKQWLALNDKRKAKYKVTMRESNWKKYVGSNTKMKNLLTCGNLEDFHRSIMVCCRCKKELSYYEVKAQFFYNVLEDDSYTNENIAGKYFLIKNPPVNFDI